MITDEITTEKQYEQILKVVRGRLERLSLPESKLANLSLGAALNLLFLLAGEWGSVGEYMPTIKAVHALVGGDLWAEPGKQLPVMRPRVH